MLQRPRVSVLTAWPALPAGQRASSATLTASAPGQAPELGVSAGQPFVLHGFSSAAAR